MGLACACPVAVFTGVVVGYGKLGGVAALVLAGLVVRMVRDERARAKQARYARRQRQRARLRLSEPEVWLERFREELDSWDMTVESLLAKAGPEPPHEFLYATPPALYDQDDDAFGDPL